MMTPTQPRETVVRLIDEAIAAGARRSPACQVVGISARTLQRWCPKDEQQVRFDQRPLAKHPEPANKLSEAERQAIRHTCNQAEYASLLPRGLYITSESTIYRALIRLWADVGRTTA